MHPAPEWASILPVPLQGRPLRPLPRFAILRSACFRVVARVFAVLLLCWTTADLCGGLCVHDHEPIAASVAAGTHGARSVSLPSAPLADSLPTAPDDCFCCSHFVQPQVRYQAVPAYTFVASVEVPAVSRPQFPPSQLYHPPLA